MENTQTDPKPFIETALNRGGFDGARARFVLDVIRNNADIVRELLGLPPVEKPQQ